MRFRSTKHVRWYAVIACGLVALHFFGVLKPFERRVRDVADIPIQFLRDHTQSVFFRIALWKSKTNAETELPEVIRERDLLKTRIALVEAENATLRKELQYPARSSWQTVGADVISKTTDLAEQALIINRGVRDGILVHQIVFTEQGIFVGEIISVSQDRSVVRLLNDRQSRIGVLLGKNAHQAGIAEGGYGLGVRLSLIPPQEVVEHGDVLVTDNTSEFMPQGLVVGRATSVGRETYEPFQHALVDSAIVFDEIRHVSIILKK